MPLGSRRMALEAREIVVTVPISFETGEQVTGLRVIPPADVDWRLIGVGYAVTKALAGTDAGLVDVKDAAGNVAITQISVPLSTVIDARGTGTLSATDARLRVGAGQSNAYHAITVSKATAGGKALLFLYYRRIQPASVQT
jgi:hypothetical protein